MSRNLPSHEPWKPRHCEQGRRADGNVVALHQSRAANRRPGGPGCDGSRTHARSSPAGSDRRTACGCSALAGEKDCPRGNPAGRRKVAIGRCGSGAWRETEMPLQSSKPRTTMQLVFQVISAFPARTWRNLVYRPHDDCGGRAETTRQSAEPFCNFNFSNLAALRADTGCVAWLARCGEDLADLESDHGKAVCAARGGCCGLRVGLQRRLSTRPVRIIVPFPPGAIGGAIGRLLARS